MLACVTAIGHCIISLQKTELYASIANQRSRKSFKKKSLRYTLWKRNSINYGRNVNDALEVYMKKFYAPGIFTSSGRGLMLYLIKKMLGNIYLYIFFDLLNIAFFVISFCF